MSVTPRLRLTALFLLLSLLFASDLVVIKFGLSGNPPLVFAGLRYVLGGLAVLLAMIALPKFRSMSQRDLFTAILLGALAAIEFGCLYLGMQYISAGATSILYYTQPIIVAALATVFLKERFSWNKAFALIFGFVGALLIFLETPSTSLVSLGGLLVLLSAFSWAAGTIAFKKLVSSENFLFVSSVMLVSAGTLLLLCGNLFETTLIVSLNLALTLLYLAFVCSAFGVTVWFYLLKRHEAIHVSTSLFLVPAFGVLFGWSLLGENVYATEIIGIICIGVSIMILNK
jgi:drug/metabolite transporter (DMT)-like permease